jgi:hypothetical protein
MNNTGFSVHLMLIFVSQLVVGEQAHAGAIQKMHLRELMADADRRAMTA